MKTSITSIEIYALTDVGQAREHNEDYSAVRFSTSDTAKRAWRFDPIKGGIGQKVDLTGQAASILIVADGMGGTNAGEVASRKAVEVIRKHLDEKGATNDRDDMEDLLKESIEVAHEDIVREAEKDPEKQGMGTTAIVACIFDTCLYVAWCGDSRAYVLRNGSLYAHEVRGNEPHYPFTDDHSVVWEWHIKNPEMMKSDLSRTHPDSNIITQSLGDKNKMPKPGFKSLDIQKGDKILLCSDGLNGMIADADIAAIMNQPRSTQQIVQDLVNEANRKGGHDNITAIMAAILEGPKPKKPLPGSSANGQQKERKTTKRLYAIIAALSLAVIALLILLVLPEGEQSTENGTAEKNDSTAEVSGSSTDSAASGSSSAEEQSSESNGTQEEAQQAAEENDNTAQAHDITPTIEESDSPTDSAAADSSTVEEPPSESNGTKEDAGLNLVEKNSGSLESGNKEKKDTVKPQDGKTEEKVKNNTKPDELNKI